MKNYIKALVWLMILSSCSKKTSNEEIKILLIGDVQLASDLNRYNEESWNNQQMDTLLFGQLFKEVLEREKPDYIIQTGDWVNYNEGLSLRILDTLEQEIGHFSLPYKEWDYMQRQIPTHLKDRFYIVIGNHDSYKTIVQQGIFHPGHNILANLNTVQFDLYESTDKKDLLLDHFPHLEKATFHGNTGSYFIHQKGFSLLSIDGLDKNRDSLLTFIEKQLAFHQDKYRGQLLIAGSHYPVFTGRAREDDPHLVFKDIREELIQLFDQYKVDLFLNGHEHFYLRYLKGGFQKAGFKNPLPQHTKYITISNFVNPYGRSIKRLNEENLKNDARYFNGIHYSFIRINKSSWDFQTLAYDENQDNWLPIDSLSSNTSSDP